MPLDSTKSWSKSRKFSIFTKGCLVQIFTTRGVVAPPANNLIMSETLIRSFRHLEHQNPSIISWDIGRGRSMQQFRRNGGGTEEWRNTVDTMSVLIIYNFLLMLTMDSADGKADVWQIYPDEISSIEFTP